MAVLIFASEESGVNLSNSLFESLREHVTELTQDGVLAEALEDAQYTYSLDLRLITMRQRESIAFGLATLKARATERDGLHPSFFTHVEKVRNYVLDEGVQP
ncbi:hypothetical protein HLB42_07325 [Deinococcus sp. D7000]|nr:hypothetical protein HLB42_07325 [Deinococcus sp. D7000]